MARVLAATAAVWSLTLVPPPAVAQSAVPFHVSHLLRQGLNDSALAVVRSALRVDSLQSSLWLSLAEVQQARHARRAQMAALRRAVALSPKSVEARTNLAAVFVESGPVDSASYYSLSALEQSNRTSPEAFYLVGRVFEQRGMIDSALVYYRWACKLLPREELF